MSKSIAALLPEWHCLPSGPCSHLVVYKKGERVGDIALPSEGVSECVSEGVSGGVKDHVVFGRKREQCDVLLEHQSISRQHAVLFFGPSEGVSKGVSECVSEGVSGVYLMDLGSSHGTLVDGKRLEPHTPSLLSPQSTVVFGQSSRTYKLQHATLTTLTALTTPTTLTAVKKKPPVPMFSGKNAFETTPGPGPVAAPVAPVAPVALTAAEQKQQERLRRQAEIDAMVQEMSQPVPVPIFESVQVNESNRADLNKVGHMTYVACAYTVNVVQLRN
jgi:pSer/pThr/pTyr-binding forkhead associated (FHA) protein